MDWQEFDKNRAAFPPEELLAYRGQYIAWSPDGTRIIASDKDGLKLDDTVRALGYDPAEVIFSSVPDAERLFIEGPMYEGEDPGDNRGFSSRGEGERSWTCVNSTRIASPFRPRSYSGTAASTSRGAPTVRGSSPATRIFSSWMIP